MPKWITKPPPVHFADMDQTFDGFIDQIVSDPQNWGSSMSVVRRGTRIADASRKISAGESFVIDDQDHALLLTTLEKPSQPWHPTAMRAYDSFVVAIEQASDKAPSPPT